MVDTNVVAYLYLPGDHTARAEALLEHDPDWAAPLLWRSEFRNILAGYMRRKRLVFEAARDIQMEAESLLAGAEYEVDSRLVLELVRDSECSARDCECGALAMALGVKFVTMDARLLEAFPKRAVAFSPGRCGRRAARWKLRHGSRRPKSSGIDFGAISACRSSAIANPLGSSSLVSVVPRAAGDNCIKRQHAQTRIEPPPGDVGQLRLIQRLPIQHLQSRAECWCEDDAPAHGGSGIPDCLGIFE